VAPAQCPQKITGITAQNAATANQRFIAMSNKKDIDKLFREKLGDGREVPFDEGAWKKMAALLDKNTPGNLSGGQQGFIATIGILFALSLSFFTQNHSEPDYNTASDAIPLEIVSKKTPAPFPKSDNLNVNEESSNGNTENDQNDLSYNGSEMINPTASVNTNEPAISVPETKIPPAPTPHETPHIVMSENERPGSKTIDLISRDAYRNFHFPLIQRGIIYMYIPGMKPLKNQNAEINTPKSTLYLTGGLIISRTFTGNAFSLRTAYAAPMGGLGYSKQLSHKWSVWGEMYYHERSGYGLENVEEVEGEGRLIYYEEEVESVKSGQNIHLLLGGRYNFIKRHSIALGGYAGYLLQTTRARRTIIYADQIITEPHPDPVYGREGLSHWDAGLLLDYGFTITPRWELALRFQQGFIDQSNADFFRGAGCDLTQQYGILLRWRFRK
jgi:hypothetical protein